jgi:hypothetical protein
MNTASYRYLTNHASYSLDSRLIRFECLVKEFDYTACNGEQWICSSDLSHQLVCVTKLCCTVARTHATLTSKIGE